MTGNRTARRLRAAFLWALSAMMLMLLLVIAAWVSTMAQVNRASAQSSLQCQPSQGTIDEAMDRAGELGLRFHELLPAQADIYIGNVISTRPAGSEGLRAVVTVFQDGYALLAMVEGGILCTPYLTVRPSSHRRAIDAAIGVAS